MQYLVASSFLAFWLMLLAGGCAPGTDRSLAAPSQARRSSIACVDAPPGSRCSMAMGEGDSAVAMSCTKQADGAVACDGQ
jgi:hypothetical protein